MILKPQDLLMVLKLAVVEPRQVEVVGEPSLGSTLPSLHMPSLIATIGLSSTGAHEALKRVSDSGLAIVTTMPARARRGRPGRVVLINRPALIEFVQHGVRYVFMPDRGRIVRGMVTGAAAPVLSDAVQGASVPSVWPDPRGETRGESFSPLYRSAVGAAQRDPELYALLALVDAIRGGSAREREVAAQLFFRRVSRNG